MRRDGLGRCIRSRGGGWLAVVGSTLVVCAVTGFISGNTIVVDEGYAADAAGATEISIGVPVVISISSTAVEGAIDIAITPTALGAFNSTDLTVTVDTNNMTGYSLVMSSSTENTNLTSDSNNTIPTITPHVDLTSPVMMPENSWGFWRWLDSESSAPGEFAASFASVPPVSSPLKMRETEAPGVSADTVLTFAAKADLSRPAGTYTSTVVFTAMANYVPEPPRPIQEFTATECMNMPMGEIVQKVDMRDRTVYRIKKMADGKCWMIDDLALDLGAEYDGKPNWLTAPVEVEDGQRTYDNAPYYYMNNNIVNQGQIPNNGSPKATYLYNWCAALADFSANCASSRTAPANNTVINGVAVGGTTSSQPEVTGICPEPFRLPKGGPGATAGNPGSTPNEYAQLDIAVGGTGGNRYNANTGSNFTTLPTVDSEGKYWSNILGGVYSFMILGDPYFLMGPGSLGIYTTSTASMGIANYTFHINKNNTIEPAYDLDKWTPLAVRCVLSP